MRVCRDVGFSSYIEAEINAFQFVARTVCLVPATPSSPTPFKSEPPMFGAADSLLPRSSNVLLLGNTRRILRYTYACVCVSICIKTYLFICLDTYIHICVYIYMYAFLCTNIAHSRNIGRSASTLNPRPAPCAAIRLLVIRA